MHCLPLFLLLLYFVTPVPGRAQTIPGTVNTVFPAGARVESEHFTGSVWVERLLQAGTGEQPVAVGNVTFPPRSRSNWHHHPAGQSLLVLDGVGYYQERGEAVRVLRKGETVQCPPDIEHWHGAANDHWFVQLAMTTEHPEGRVIWGAPVTETEYRAGIPVQRAAADTAGLVSTRYRHLATLASLAALGDLERLQTACDRALDAGLTVNKCREVMLHLYAYAGFPRSIRGIQTLMATLAERRERGIVDEAGSEAGPIDERRAKYERGKAVLDSLVGRTHAGRSAYGDFAPAIDVFLKEHLFADLFERDVLSYREREITTVSILVSLGGVEPMLGSHLGIALNLGVPEAQLREVVDVIATTAGRASAQTAASVLDRVLER